MQCDELWGFCWCKEKPTDSPLIGDAWCYVGIEKSSKLILAWHLGRRDAPHTVEFTEKLREATSGRFQLTSDGWGLYPAAVEFSLGMRVDYAKLIKVYRATRPDEAPTDPALSVIRDPKKSAAQGMRTVAFAIPTEPPVDCAI